MSVVEFPRKGNEWERRGLGRFIEEWACFSVVQACPTLCDPRDCRPSGSSDHGILQVRIGLPFHSPEDLPDPEIKPGSPGLQADSLQSEPLRAKGREG